MTPRRHCLPDTKELIDINSRDYDNRHKTYTCSNETKFQHRVGSRHKILTKKLFAIDIHWAGEISFLQGNATGCLSHTPGQVSCSHRQHKINSMIL